jgi:DNA-binding MarR family transcriptional regulator
MNAGVAMSGKVAKAVIRAAPSLQDQALELIERSPGGLLQSDLWKIMGIESSTCSRIVRKLASSGLIYRERPPSGNRSTYLLQIAKKPKVRERPFSQNIDRYLTEIYVLYLIRGIDN